MADAATLPMDGLGFGSVNGGMLVTRGLGFGQFLGFAGGVVDIINLAMSLRTQESKAMTIDTEESFTLER